MCETIGTYKVLAALGRGGMGIVYRARHMDSGVTVALKTVRIPAPKWLDCIRREVSALKSIRHPGVVRIVDHGVHDGRPWYAMDLLEGESLRRFGQRIWRPYQPSSTPVSSTQELSETEDLHVRPTDSLDGNDPSLQPRKHPPGTAPPAAGHLQQVLVIMRRFCATLAYLHGEGFVNGDLKPENVLLVDDQPVVIDFGLTAHHPGGCGREALETQWGMAGTLPYMSPEQIRGELLDARSDLYSVGCMLYELLTGVPPFVGSAAAIIHQHLALTPAPPSELVKGMPKELERLVLNLLEKDLSRRSGYADEVAEQLAELACDARPLSGFPAPRAYIYRPRLSGRDAVLARLTELRDRSRQGSGSLVLLGGESGVGKTRLAMELTRTAPAVHMRVVTSESSALATESAAAVGPAPLHALRTLLQAVADRCHEGGSRVTERLLGARRAVLALYEPALLHVPAKEGLTPIIPLDVEASRQRLFRYLGETLGCLADEQPLLWILDDLGWADELSLAFLRSLTREFLEAHPLFILCAYRTEEPSPELSTIVALPHVHHITLARLGEDAVNAMIGDMLALGDALDGFTQFVVRQAEGNPFFVAEYLRAAVAERVLRRGRLHSWNLGEKGNELGSDSATLELPHSLRSLIERRFRRLGPDARHTMLAAAVLGRDADLDLLFEVAGLSAEAFSTALDELIRSQVLEQPQPSNVRFAHDKLREVAYTKEEPSRLHDLHLRAASALESLWQKQGDRARDWAMLGHHFAAAQSSARAAHYLKLAADHARATHANGEAIRLYQEAIKQVHQNLLRLENAPSASPDTLVALHESLGDVLALLSRREPARAAYATALTHVPIEAKGERAALQRKLGRTWAAQHEYSRALDSYSQAERALAPLASSMSQAEWDEWVQLRMDQLSVYYWLDRVPEMDRLSEELDAIVRAKGSPLQKAKYYYSQWLRNLRSDKYSAGAQTVAFAEAAMQASCEAHDPAESLQAHFGMGLTFMFRRQFDLAKSNLRAGLALAETGGDLSKQSRCLTYLSVTSRMQGDLDETRALTDRVSEVAKNANALDNLAAARANYAWLALHGGDHHAASGFGRDALDRWSKLPIVFPLQWMALLPLLEVELTLGDLGTSIAYAKRLLAPDQQCLPEQATGKLSEALHHWEAGMRDGSYVDLKTALQQLKSTEFQ